MYIKVEQGYTIKFCTLPGKSVTETAKMIRRKPLKMNEWVIGPFIGGIKNFWMAESQRVSYYMVDGTQHQRQKKNEVAAIICEELLSQPLQNWLGCGFSNPQFFQAPFTGRIWKNNFSRMEIAYEAMYRQWGPLFLKKKKQSHLIILIVIGNKIL